jgi:hypothetical protein
MGKVEKEVRWSKQRKRRGGVDREGGYDEEHEEDEEGEEDYRKVKKEETG